MSYMRDSITCFPLATSLKCPFLDFLILVFTFWQCHLSHALFLRRVSAVSSSDFSSNNMLFTQFVLCLSYN